MSPAARRFYRWYHIATQLLPGYLIAAALYFTLYLDHSYRQGGVGEWWAPYRWAPVVAVLLEPLISGLALYLTLIPWRKVPALPESMERLDQMWLAVGATAAQPAPVITIPLTQLVELGRVPYLGYLRAPEGELWISTYTLWFTPEPELAVLVNHELGHALYFGTAERERRPLWMQFNLPRLVWLAAPLVAAYLASQPLLLALAAAVHVSVWVRLHAWTTALAERRADRRAAERVGRARYIEVLARHLRQFEQPGLHHQPGTALRRSRLRGMGLSEIEIKDAIAVSELPHGRLTT